MHNVVPAARLAQRGSPHPPHILSATGLENPDWMFIATPLKVGRILASSPGFAQATSDASTPVSLFFVPGEGVGRPL